MITRKRCPSLVKLRLHNMSSQVLARYDAIVTSLLLDSVTSTHNRVMFEKFVYWDIFVQI